MIADNSIHKVRDGLRSPGTTIEIHFRVEGVAQATAHQAPGLPPTEDRYIVYYSVALSSNEDHRRFRKRFNNELSSGVVLSSGR